MVLGLAGSDGVTDWLAGDGRGSTDRDGGRDPWGHDPAPAADGMGPDLGYLGEVDLDGLVWLRNRMYDPETRLFLSPDPLPGIPGLPIAANPYAYANNDPIGFVDPLGLQGQPLSVDQYNEIRAQETGPQWGNIVTVGLVVVGVATMFIPGLNLAGAALIGVALGAAGGAAPGIIQGIQTGNWDWGSIGGGALKGAIIGGLSFGAARGFGSLGSQFGTVGGRFGTAVFSGGSWGSAAFRGGLLGAGEGLVSGTGTELYDLTPLPGSDGQFNPEGIAASTVFGAGTGAGAGTALYRPPSDTSAQVPDPITNIPGVPSNSESFPGGSMFSGVYDPASGSILAYPSGDTVLTSGATPELVVPRYGGHGVTSEAMTHLTGSPRSTHLAFTATVESSDTVGVRFFSRGVNGSNPSFTGLVVPSDRQPPVLDALSRASGMTARPRR